VILSTISTAYAAHYTAPKLWQSRSLIKYQSIVQIAFGLSMILYICITTIGFLTFRQETQGSILNNYSINDPLAMIARLAVGLGMIGTFPISFHALRENIMDLFHIVSKRHRNILFYPLTVFLLLIITYLALITRNVSQVVSLSGALIGSLLIYVFPGIMMIGLYQQQQQQRSAQDAVVLTRYERWELIGNYALVLLGILLCTFGVWQNLQSNFSFH
jgi:solute carrier family 38 (sodium-coupled neutral amino acid transporter), member 11